MKDVLVITGGTSGIGLILAQHFHLKYRLVVVSRDPEKALRSLHGLSISEYISGDVYEDADRICAEIHEKVGEVWGLINCAGVLGEVAPFSV